MSESEKISVLVIDKDRLSRRALVELLESTSYLNVFEAESGYGALKVLVRSDVTMIVLDPSLPDMDGFEMLGLMSQNKMYKNLPVLIVGPEKLSNSLVEKTIGAGASDYMSKPLNTDLLLLKVRLYTQMYLSSVREFELKNKKDAILDVAGEGILELGADGKLLYVNESAIHLLETSSEDLLGSSFDQWFEYTGDFGHGKACFNSLYEHTRKALKYKSDKIKVISEREGFGLIELLSTYHRSRFGDTLVILFKDISDRIKTENELIRTANVDTLTGLSNRASFQQELHRNLSRSSRSGVQIALYLLDLDDFKKINDTLGHNVGDSVLQAVGFRLKNCLRDYDVIARLGGDEFAVIAENANADLHSIEVVAAKIVSEIAKPFEIDGKVYTVETSLGVAYTKSKKIDATEFLKDADLALYSAKRAGRNIFRLYKTSMSEEIRKQSDMEKNLRSAIDKKEICAHFQPQVSLSKNKIVGFEALARWFPKGGKAIPPFMFIELAEQFNLIDDIGKQILSLACREVQRLGDEEVVFSVNLSPKQIALPNCVESIQEITQAYNIPKGSLSFEITETAILHNIDHAIGTLKKIKAMGFTLALDDFGTGYSSLSYLHRLPVDIIKIDRCFVNTMLASDKTFSLVEAIIAIAKSFDLKVVAEGAETLEQVLALESLGCDKIQGYYFGKPVSSKNMTIDHFDNDNWKNKKHGIVIPEIMNVPLKNSSGHDGSSAH